MDKYSAVNHITAHFGECMNKIFEVYESCDNCIKNDVRINIIHLLQKAEERLNTSNIN